MAEVGPIEPAAAVSEERLRQAEAYVEAEEGVVNRLSGIAGTVVTSIAVAMTLFHLYAAYDIVPTQPLRYTHVGFVMVLCFLSFPMATRFRNHIRWWDIAAAAASVAILAYALWGGEDFTDRATSPTRLDVVLGVVFTILLLEATRRTSGWIMPFVGLLFIAYAMAGPHLPPPWTHRGYDLSRLVGHLFITLEGIFGVAVERVLVVDNPVHHLRRLSAAFRRRQILHRFLVGSHGRQAEQCRTHGRAVVLSARRSVRIGRGDHGHHRRCGVPDDAARGV